MSDAPARFEVPESGALADAVASAERGNVVPLMRRGRPVAAVVSLDAAYAAKIYAAIEESRAFLERYRAAHPAAPHDPDELQARMMRRSGCPTVEHYTRVFRTEGMPAEAAEAEARRMVEADRELLARYPAP
jgi:antitoxin (DNA-binding transcriptional repressor) of toxin-antitoxin stability system